MEVKIDANELCELKQELAKYKEWNRLAQVGNAWWTSTDGNIKELHDLTRKIKSIGEERDWWRDQAIRRGNTLTALKYELDSYKLYELFDGAGSLGYELSE